MTTTFLGRLAAVCVAVSTIAVALILSYRTDPSQAAESPARTADTFSPYVGGDGSISRPTDYREKFVFLGTYADATKAGQSVDEIHNVYAPVDDVKAYQRDGKFPDGTVLVKEVCSADTGKLTTGQAHWVKDVKVWFVMVKDSKGRFPGNGLWGDGWGWALFKANEPARNVATNFKSDCLPCHVPAKQDDWLYIRGYPLLGKHAAAR
jgi:hypothetical protein